MPSINQSKRGKQARKEYTKGAYKESRYNTQQWRNVRALILQDSPLCKACEEVGLITLAQMVDHINPVRLGGEFWDRDNLQPLCNSCHARKSAKERHSDPYGV
jgi:5-methylcytosine-specific restriction enzyme A